MEGVPEVEIRFGRAALMPTREAARARTGLSGVRARLATVDARLENRAAVRLRGRDDQLGCMAHEPGSRPGPVRSVHYASTYVVVMTAAMNGAGLSMAHDTLASGLLGEGRLERASDHSVAMPEGYFLLPPADHEQTPASRAFIEWLEEPFARRE